MRYKGKVYRPPSEAYSLIVQVTYGCSHNKCAFCNMYKDKKFSIRPVEEVLRDLAEARSYERRIERIFLADGDALILPMDYLLQVLDFIREYFPECTRVAAYATTKAIERKTDEELRKLREHGLLNSASLNVIKPGDVITLGGFTVEAIHVNHSIPDALGDREKRAALQGGWHRHLRHRHQRHGWSQRRLAGPRHRHGKGRQRHEAGVYRFSDAARLLRHSPARLDRGGRVSGPPI